MKNYLCIASMLDDKKLAQHRLVCKDCSGEDEAKKRHLRVLRNVMNLQRFTHAAELVIATKPVPRRFSNNEYDLFELTHGYQKDKPASKRIIY
jgi:hypothetical protein